MLRPAVPPPGCLTPLPPTAREGIAENYRPLQSRIIAFRVDDDVLDIRNLPGRFLVRRSLESRFAAAGRKPATRDVDAVMWLNASRRAVLASAQHNVVPGRSQGSPQRGHVVSD